MQEPDAQVDNSIKIEMVLKREQRLWLQHQEEINQAKLNHLEEKNQLLMEIKKRDLQLKHLKQRAKGF